jgi:peptide deformylase
MSVVPIVTIPDPILTTKTSKVKVIDDVVKQNIQDLRDTLSVAKDPEGAGLAASQLGISKQICIVRNFFQDPANTHKIIHQDFVLINPKIISTSKETEIDWEGCLSIPDTYGKVERFSKIKITAEDEHGDEFKLKADGFFARTIQHEIDHLNGILFTDRVIGRTISEQQLDAIFEKEENNE